MCRAKKGTESPPRLSQNATTNLATGVIDSVTDRLKPLLGHFVLKSEMAILLEEKLSAFSTQMLSGVASSDTIPAAALASGVVETTCAIPAVEVAPRSSSDIHEVQSSAPTFLQGEVNYVRLQNLKAAALNKRAGTVQSYDSRAGRYGVLLHGDDAPKSIKSRNLCWYTPSISDICTKCSQHCNLFAFPPFECGVKGISQNNDKKPSSEGIPGVGVGK